MYLSRISFVAVRGNLDVFFYLSYRLFCFLLHKDLSVNENLFGNISLNIIDLWDGENAYHYARGCGDYGPSPFRVYHSWFTKDGFDKLVEDSWKTSSFADSSKITILRKKFQALKASIKAWCKDDKQRSMELHNINKCHSLDMAQKAKVRWSIEGDENSKFFHGIINMKRSQLAIRGVLIEGDWIDKPYKVKNEFLNHFSNRFARPTGPNIVLDSNMFKQLSSEQIADLECDVTYDEIKRAVWDCGTNKSPGPDGFTFDFIRTYWKIINQDVVNAVREFFVTSKFPPGSNSSFIALIPKKQDAKLVKDFRPISLIGCFYKIIAKILANRLSMVISDLISDVQSAFVPNHFEKAFDSVRWDYLDGILSNFGFGSKWREWIHGCLTSAMGSILVNGSPTSEFKFHKGLKQGDPLSPFLFILVMESLHLSFNNILNAGLFKGIRIDDSLTLSHLFYADDAVFIGKWDRANVVTIVHMLKCFFMASGLQINIHKSKLMGIGVSQEEVRAAASIIGCSTFSNPFTYLGVKVGMSSSKRKSWDEVIGKISARLSKWKIKTLSIGGCLTLIKLVLTSLPLYHMSIYKAPMGVLRDMESFRRRFFNGSVLRSSPWNCIIRELSSLSSQGINLLAHLKKKVGNGVHTSFWEDSWIKRLFPLSQSLPLGCMHWRKETIFTVAEKISEATLIASFRRAPRGGVEEDQFIQLVELVDSVILSNSNDRWVWLLDPSGEYSVSSARTYIDDLLLPTVGSPTRWAKLVNLARIFSSRALWLGFFGVKLLVGGILIFLNFLLMKSGLLGLSLFGFLKLLRMFWKASSMLCGG
ncbi:RNA-directed DNA polymerase, eukaryota [Tanacetum coccineum]